MQNLKEKLLALGIFEDNEYLDKYVELIESNRDTKKEKFKTDRHHIIPKAYFKYKNIELDNSKDNFVYLLYKNHVLAHYYLAKCSKNDYIRYCNECAVNYTISKLTKQSDVEIIESLDGWQKFKEDYMLLKSTKHKNWYNSLSEEEKSIFKKKLSQGKKKYFETHSGTWLGKKHTEESKEKMSISAKKRGGHAFTEEQKRKISESNKGRKNYTNGKIDLIVMPGDIIPEGFYPGISDNKRKKLIEKNPNKGKHSWNYNKCMSDETKEKMSVSHKGLKTGGKYIYKNGIKKFISKNELHTLNEYITDGWILFGRHNNGNN